MIQSVVELQNESFYFESFQKTNIRGLSMKLLRNVTVSIFVVSIFAFLSGCSGTSPEYSQYKYDLDIQMQEMINVLFGGHNTEFMEKYVDPSYIQKMGGINSAMIPFTNDRSRALQAALRIAKQTEPTYNPAGKQMSYFGTGLPVPIVFKMKNGKWYLQDDWLKQ